MKKIFFLAASVLASASMMAAVDFQYLPTAGDQPAGVEKAFNTSDKVAVPAGTKFCEGEHFKVYNAYATSYKVVGMMTDTAYSHLQIGDVTVDYTTQRVQGQDNPTAGGANPVIDMKTPNGGACYKVEVDKDGWLYIAVKTTPNKQQFVFESAVENQGNVGGTFIGYQYLTLSSKTGTQMSVEFEGDANNYNALMAPPAMPYTYFTSSAFSENGVGVIAVQVFSEGSPYIIGTAGSKMMACGVGFSEEAVEVKALGSKGVVKGDAAPVDYEDVVLSDKTSENYKTINLTEAPIFFRVALPSNELANDSTNIWTKYTVTYDADHKPTYKLAANIYAWVWGKDKKGNDVEGKWLQAAKSGSYYVLQIDGYSVVNLVLNADGEWSDANHQTRDIIGVTHDMCYRIGDVPADKDTKCDAIKLDCLTGGLSAVENTEVEEVADKFIENGHLYIRKNGVIYNAVGAVVK